MSDPTEPGVKPGAALALALLFLVATINFVDRQILVILLQPIKEDLNLSDTQLGLLTGVGFALCFAIAGIPIARLAESTSRRVIVSASLAAWSLLTAACGLAQSFLQLIAARAIVAIAESGSGPASQSMLADLFPHGRRAMALAVFSCAVPAGVLIGLALGGFLNETVGWRYAFILVGLPGTLLAGLLLLVVEEPRSSSPTDLHARRQNTMLAFNTIWSIRSYRFLALAAAIHLFAAAGFNQWIASYLIRTYALGTRELGLSLGLVIGLAGGVATLAGGYLGDRLGRKDPRWFAWLPALVAAGGVPFTLGIYFAADSTIALLFLTGTVISATAYMGPVFGAVQSIAPPQLRATAAALTMFLGGVVGQAAGPTAVGLLSDAFGASVGADSLRWALIIIAPVSLVAAALFWMAARSMQEDLRRAQPIPADRQAPTPSGRGAT